MNTLLSINLALLPSIALAHPGHGESSHVPLVTFLFAALCVGGLVLRSLLPTRAPVRVKNRR